MHCIMSTLQDAAAGQAGQVWALHRCMLETGYLIMLHLSRHEQCAPMQVP